MRASLPRTIWIIIRTLYSTLKISIMGLYLRYRGAYDREFADRILRWWAGFLLESVDCTYEVSNKHAVKITTGKPFIIMSNHLSHYDIPLIFVALPGSIRMLTKKELFKVPIWGRALKAAEFLSIDRHNREQAIKDLDNARAQMATGLAVWIAPEGTRSRSGKLGTFKKGGFVLAIQTQAMIIPVGITGSEKILHANSLLKFNLSQHVKVNIGPPIDASRYSLESRDQLIENTRDAIATLTGEKKQADLLPTGTDML